MADILCVCVRELLDYLAACMGSDIVIRTSIDICSHIGSYIYSQSRSFFCLLFENNGGAVAVHVGT